MGCGGKKCAVAKYSVSQIRLHSSAAASAPAEYALLALRGDTPGVYTEKKRSVPPHPQLRASLARRIDALGATPYL
jgi:hypothetical protein